MIDAQASGTALLALLALALAGWLWSLPRSDVSGVDSLWPLFFLAGALVYAWQTVAISARGHWVLALLTLWSLRLAAHLTWRNYGQPEDRRYQAIRARNEPGFAWKSVYLVFGLQAVLAWIIALPLLAALGGDAPWSPWDAAGCVLWAVGFLFESVSDWQLARFRADPARGGHVLDHGLWRYTRHPNYFGEATLWWGFYLFGLAAGGWWTIVGPLLLTWLLLRVSGVTLLERDIGERRPGYRDYVARTSAFLPRPPRRYAGQPPRALR
jgi:steroid 5-alpha reductase family enzyme